MKGRKRQVMVDPDGRALVLQAQPASVRGRDGAVPVLNLSRRAFPLVIEPLADAGYAGERPAMAKIGDVQIVSEPPDQVAVAVNPRRWIIERFFAGISRNRRLWKDRKATLASSMPPQ